MIFSSITFLFFFLPGTLLLYFLSGRYKNVVLLGASLLFYAWGESIYLAVMLCSIAINYSCGRLMFYRGAHEPPAKSIIIVGLVLNFAILAFFKYANFLTENANLLLDSLSLPHINLSPVHLPIGISFFTFQAVSYLVDVYRRKVVPQTNIINLGLFIALFPQLIAGPIVRYHDIAKEIVKRKVSCDNFAYGVRRFLFGLSKKVLLANPLALSADKIFALPFTELSMPVAWLGALCYTMQIYFDFSGYSDMAIGLGRMFGFRFLENFNYPYISKSIQEFWRRWHISLSSWLRDYLYIPLGGNRLGTIRTYFNLVTVFLICGLWHGASWTFIIWGLYHGLFLIFERTPAGKLSQRLWPPLQHIFTLVIIIIGWVIFRSDSIGDALTFTWIMFGFGTSAVSGYESLGSYVDSKLMFELSLGLACSLPLLPALEQFVDRLTSVRGGKTALLIGTSYEAAQLFLISTLTYYTVISLAAGVYNPFIYFRF